MNLVGQRVKHKTLRDGMVTSFDGTYVVVEFLSRTCKFMYPDIFSSFLSAEDSLLQKEIEQEILNRKLAKEEEKRIAEEQRREAEIAKLEKIAETAGKSTKEMKPKLVKRKARTEGTRMTFFVFQGNTFDAEYRGGYIWAPKVNAAGHTFHHWDKLLDVRQGDVILHGVDGYVRAVSVAKGPCYDAESPVALKQEKLWDDEGRRVDCDYVEISNPIKTSQFRDTIIGYCSGVKYSPFDKDGNGNLGYLFEINDELAKVFIEASVKKNSYLLELDYIQRLLV